MRSIINKKPPTMPSVKILISYHKPAVLLKDEILTPVHCGRAYYTGRFKLGCVPDNEYDWMMKNTIGDDSGENISFEQDFNEAQAIYWAWKNYDKLDNPDYIGFMHYRRHFIFNSIKNFPHNHKNVVVSFKRMNEAVLKETGYSPGVVQDLAAGNDFIAVNPLNSNMTVYEYYKRHHIISELDYCIDIIRRDHPLLYPCAEAFFKQNLNSICNMFIMKKELFFEYCSFFFDIAFKFIKNFERSGFSAKDSRTFVLERITGLYLYHLSKRNDLKYTTLPITFIERPHIIPDYVPAFTDNNIPVVFSGDNECFGFASVAIQSIMDNSNAGNNYDVFIMGRNIAEDYREKITGMISGHNNFSVRYVDMDDFLDLFEVDADREKIKFVFTEAAYYRIWIPKIFKNYKKIVYLDCDLVVKCDIAELYGADLGNRLLGAAPDIGVFCRLYKNHGQADLVQKYIGETLKLASPYDYIQAGVLLFNVEEMNKTGFFEKCFVFLDKNPKLWFKVQDVINHVCRDTILRFSVNWNMEWHCVFSRKGDPLNKVLPKKYFEAYMDARKNTNIIHFTGGRKPWTEPDRPMANVFWQYARRSPFYETILSDMMIYGSAGKKINAGNPYYYSNHLWLLKKIEGVFYCIRENGIRYTIKLIGKKAKAVC